MIRSSLVAILTAVAIVAGCAHQPTPPEAQRIEQVQPGPLHTSGLVEFKIVDADSPSMQRLIEHVPPEVVVERDRWASERAARPTDDVFLSAPSRADLERYVSSVPSLTLPEGREIAFGRIDNPDRWRTYIVHAEAALDETDIASAELTRDAAHDRFAALVTFTPHGAREFSDLTEKMVGQKLAVLLDGSVVAAPVIGTKITGGQARITFAR
ncbi:MAG TPA: hypothetical protein VGM90_16770 [Kofleriaceae bacterium]|jgi:hypothetical protein